jgi:two-component system, NarL family, invasion response regulator UvrY
VKTALIFEDFEPIAEVWKMTLEKIGFTHITVINNPEKDNFLFSNVTADIVLMDINLSGSMNGFEVTRRILEENKDVKIIVVSMDTQQTYLNKALSLGAKGYVAKNSPLLELIEAIQKVEAGEIYICEQMRNS